ncbi:hypothetical protein T484DRAFT_1859866 [Baffinella frigidus]|nr:hypothetical protein T484DRAFT_1859866 [Cryptophyta sp. CCMP2293]
MAVQQEPTSGVPLHHHLGPDTGQHGVGLVFRTTRDGKMVVSSFVKDSSAYECGLVRDGDILNSVEGQSVENLPVAAIHMMLLGAQDSWTETALD